MKSLLTSLLKILKTAFFIFIFILCESAFKNPAVLAQSQERPTEPVEEDEETLRQQGISGRAGSLFGSDNTDAQSVKFGVPTTTPEDEALNAMPTKAAKSK